MVMLRVFPMKGVRYFVKKGKLAPSYVRPFNIIERVRLMAYKLELPYQLIGVHNIFNVCVLRKYFKDKEQSAIVDLRS